MQKLLPLIVAMMCAASLTNVFAAQSNTISSIGGVSVPATPDNSQVMSSEAFKGTVEKFGTETKQEINKSVQEQIKSTPNAAQQPSSSSSTNAPATAPSSNIDSGNNSSYQPNTSISNQPAGSANKPNTASTPPSTSTPPSNNNYTGFGGGETKSKNGDTGNKKGSSWNVGY